MIKNLGFEKYAYDWRNEHLDDTFTELELAARNNIEIIGVWLWLNAKRDSLQHLSADNEHLLQIIKQLDLKTTFWVGFNGNFFEGLDQEQSVKKATDLVGFIAEKVTAMDCKIALYNHSGWFGNPLNQLEVIQKLPEFNIGIIYNFHHAHGAINDFNNVANSIVPYLKAVNLNGMEVDGKKILPIGHGKHEKEMIRTLQKSGFKGPWGILGHVASRDAKEVLEENLNGLKVLLAPE
ncbi:sugar phosphate isomerase/epimerase family protein [Flagellimonas nanhaiensis]|nr:TIM barrel protein [Allomuricauda nanhaiensis]